MKKAKTTFRSRDFTSSFTQWPCIVSRVNKKNLPSQKMPGETRSELGGSDSIIRLRAAQKVPARSSPKRFITLIAPDQTMHIIDCLCLQFPMLLCGPCLSAMNNRPFIHKTPRAVTFAVI